MKQIETENTQLREALEDIAGDLLWLCRRADWHTTTKQKECMRLQHFQEKANKIIRDLKTQEDEN